MIKEVAPISAQFLRAAPSQSVIVRHGTLEVPLQGKSSSATMETFTWDHLVFATGSLYPSPFKPSASQSEYAEKAERKQRVEHFASAASKIARARHVMVVGGGIVGVELAAELAKAASRSPRRITLVHGGARLMDDLPASAGERAAKWLRKQFIPRTSTGPQPFQHFQISVFCSSCARTKLRPTPGPTNRAGPFDDVESALTRCSGANSSVPRKMMFMRPV